MLEPIFQGQFKKDLKLAEKRHYDTDAINEIIALIIMEEPLPSRCREHRLHGDYADCFECHALNDFLLVYLCDEEKVTFSRAGTHSDIF